MKKRLTHMEPMIPKTEAHPKPTKKQPPTIVVDGITYKIPKVLLSCTDEVITRTIRGWKRT